MRYAQRYWLERAARLCVDLAMNDMFEVDALQELYFESLDAYLERMRRVKAAEVCRLLIELELLGRELARRKP